MTTIWLVSDRAVHFGACLLLFGAGAFDRFVAAGVLGGGATEAAVWWTSRLRRCVALLLPIILFSGIAWFLLVAANMSGLPWRKAVQLKTLAAVWNQTDFGTDWKTRLIFWLAAAGASGLSFLKLQPPLERMLAWLELLLGGLLLGSLAWAGHGVEGPRWHLAADVTHLLVAGVWPAGLLPFALLLRELRRRPAQESWPLMAALVRRFSALSLAAVALLTVSGLANAWILVGSPANLFAQNYGRWLTAKLVLFVLAVSLGAVNLLRLKPRLLDTENAAAQASAIAACRLERNVRLELLLGTAIVAVVAVLGLLPPANR